jgi:hypothetical protein
LQTINEKFKEEWENYTAERLNGTICAPCLPGITYFAKPKCIENKCALDFNDSSDCNNDICYYLFAIQNNEPALCDKIKSEEESATCKKKANQLKYCESDYDCSPGGSCCHPEQCQNTQNFIKWKEESCEDIACTMVCAPCPVCKRISNAC